jgi:capsular polysaccharide biosynthesis protein
MDVRDLFERIRPRIWLILALAVLGGATGLAASRLSPSSFHAEARVMVGQTAVSRQVDYSNLLASQLLAQTYADLAGTTPVLDTAGKTLSPASSAAELRRSVAARAPVGSIYVIVAADASDANRAAAMANAVANALVAQAPAESKTTQELVTALQNDLVAVDGQVQATLAQIGSLSGQANLSTEQQQQLTDLQAQLETLRAQRASLAAGIPSPGSNVLTLVDPASPPAEASSPRTVVNVGLGLLVGLAAGVAFAALSTRRREPEAVVGSRARAA